MNRNLWRKKTVATLMTISQLRELTGDKNTITIGLAGFSSNFENVKGNDLEAVVKQAIQLMLKRRMKDYVPRRILLISGATNVGVPHIGYSVAKSLGCKSVGITSEEAKKYPIALLDYLTVIGENFGDESNDFISTLDELWVIGGGAQSLHECKLALDAGVPLIIFRGAGGIADSLCVNTHGATFVNL